jgi:hypothetical protein
MNQQRSAITPDGGKDAARERPAEIPDADAPQATGSGTDAARGQPEEMARTGGDSSAANRTAAPFEPATSSAGSRTGSAIGSQSERTGMGDGQPAGSSQGLGIQERPDGGPLRPSK